MSELRRKAREAILASPRSYQSGTFVGLGQECAKRFRNAGNRRTGIAEHPGQHRVDFVRRQHRQILGHCVRQRVTGGRIADVGLRESRIVLACRQVSRQVGLWDPGGQRKLPN